MAGPWEKWLCMCHQVGVLVLTAPSVFVIDACCCGGGVDLAVALSGLKGEGSTVLIVVRRVGVVNTELVATGLVALQVGVLYLCRS